MDVVVQRSASGGASGKEEVREEDDVSVDGVPFSGVFVAAKIRVRREGKVILLTRQDKINPAPMP